MKSFIINIFKFKKWACPIFGRGLLLSLLLLSQTGPGLEEKSYPRTLSPVTFTQPNGRSAAPVAESELETPIPFLATKIGGLLDSEQTLLCWWHLTKDKEAFPFKLEVEDILLDLQVAYSRSFPGENSDSFKRNLTEALGPFIEYKRLKKLEDGELEFRRNAHLHKVPDGKPGPYLFKIGKTPSGKRQLLQESKCRI